MNMRSLEGAQHDCCPHKTRQIWADGHAQKEDNEDSHVLMEAETGVMCLQAKEHQGFLANTNSRKGKEEFSPLGFRGNMALLTQ